MHAHVLCRYADYGADLLIANVFEPEQDYGAVEWAELCDALM